MRKPGSRFFIFLFLPLAVVFMAAGGREKADEPLDEVSVQLARYYQAQFAGSCAAGQNGYYAEEGPDVTLPPNPGPGTDTVALGAEGAADFGEGQGDGLIQEKPDLVMRFVRATLRDWRWAGENTEEAGLLALEYGPALGVEHEVAQMEASLPLIHTGEDRIG